MPPKGVRKEGVCRGSSYNNSGSSNRSHYSSLPPTKCIVSGEAEIKRQSRRSVVTFSCNNSLHALSIALSVK